jgi:eukaryotic-like serine/threonine-protein kinase
MSRRGWIIVIIVLAVAAAVLVAVLVVSSGGGASVPDLTGKTLAQAQTAIEAAGFTVGDVTEAADDAVPAGSVVSQDPAAGATADKGSAVALAVSTGPAAVQVPNVMGMDVADAQQALTEAGLGYETAYEYDLRAPADQVMGQLPAPGEPAAKGSSVGLLVSKGVPTETTVPDVTGLSEQQATQKLNQAGLRAVPTEAYSDTVAEGVVSGQEPAAGETAVPLSEVLIEVSLGKGAVTVAVPDLVGLTEVAATDELEALGLKPKAAQAYSPTVKKDVVMGQEPPAGTEVEPAAEVGLLVSLGAAPGPSPTPTPTPTKTSTPKPTPSPSKTVTPTPEPTKTETPKPTATPSPGPTVWPPEIDPPPGAGVDRVTVPDLNGVTVQEAQKELEKLGLESHVIEQPSEDSAKGLVMDQLPEAGRKIPQTYAVFLLVSSGPQPQVDLLPAEQ